MIMKKFFVLTFFLYFIFPKYSSGSEIKLSKELDYLNRKDIQILSFNSNGNSPKINHVVFKLNGLFYNFEVISPMPIESAAAIINNNLFILLKAFEATPTPYVGQITKIQECSTKPTVTNISKDNIQLKIVSYFSDDSLKPGICLQKKSSIEICQTIFYVSSIKSLIKIKSTSKTVTSCLSTTKKFLNELKF